MAKITRANISVEAETRRGFLGRGFLLSFFFVLLSFLSSDIVCVCVGGGGGECVRACVRACGWVGVGV